jgi:hypothetical protein
MNNGLINQPAVETTAPQKLLKGLSVAFGGFKTLVNFVFGFKPVEKRQKSLHEFADGGISKHAPEHLRNSERTANGGLKQYIEADTSNLYGPLPKNSAWALPMSKADSLLLSFSNFKGMSSKQFEEGPRPSLQADDGIILAEVQPLVVEHPSIDAAAKPQRKAEATGPSGPEL